MTDLITTVNRALTAKEFQGLADVPPEVEWFANLGNAETRRAYENALKDFMNFTGIQNPEEFRIVTRAHIIAWRDDLRKNLRIVAIDKNAIAAFEANEDKQIVTILNIFYGGRDYEAIMGSETPHINDGLDR